MDLHIGSVVVGADIVSRAVTFWCAALGYRPREQPGTDWAVLVPLSTRGGPNISIMLTDTRPQSMPRIHLDLYTPHQAAEVERLVGLGATRVAWSYPPDPDFVVLADPDGNVFCVIDKGGPGE